MAKYILVIILNIFSGLLYLHLGRVMTELCAPIQYKDTTLPV